MHAHSNTQAVFVIEEGRFGGPEARAEGFCTEYTPEPLSSPPDLTYDPDEYISSGTTP